MADLRAAGAFSRWERSVAWRYLLAKRKNGGVALISVISFCRGDAGGLRPHHRDERDERLSGRAVGPDPGLQRSPLRVQSPLINGPDRDGVISRIRAVPGVIQAVPMVEAQAMVIGPSQVTGAIVRGVTPRDLRGLKIIAENIKKPGSLAGFGQGEFGGDIVLIGDRMADQSRRPARRSDHPDLTLGPGDGLRHLDPREGLHRRRRVQRRHEPVR
jgi:lipoprotein-releasing system permease protein